MKEFILDRGEAMHERLGTAGFVLAIIALICALTGGAYAASGGLNAKQKKEVTKIAKKYAGKPGAAGAVGPAGPQGNPGAAGQAGPKGDTGAQGPQGPIGPAGAAGKSVTVADEPTGTANCEERGGVKVQVEGSAPGTAKYVCNGAGGAGGGTLTGIYGPPDDFNPAPGFTNPVLMGEENYQLAISFTNPLSSAPDFVAVPGADSNFGTAAGCPGVTNGVPTADPGKFCVYLRPGGFGPAAPSVTSYNVGDPLTPETAGKAGTAGALLDVSCASPLCHAIGVWAVTDASS